MMQSGEIWEFPFSFDDFCRYNISVMAEKIITVGFNLPGHSEWFHGYSTNQSLLDVDVVIFQTDFSGYSLDYSSESYFRGKPCYDKNSSFRVREDSQHWREQLSAALEAGKTVFVLFRKFEEVYVHTGEKQVSGTGRNSRVTNMVTLYNNYEFFPVQLPSIVSAEGEEITFSGNPVFSSFWNEFKDHLRYESYLDGKIANTLFLTRTGEKIVGALFKVGKGNLVLLPKLEYDEERFTRYNKKTDEAFWTKDAVAFGNRLLKALLDIDKALRKGGDRTPPPEWTKDDAFELVEENRLKVEIEERSTQIDALVVQKNELITKLDHEVRVRDLLFEKGHHLENAIIDALAILGCQAENYNDGNLEIDQVINSPEGDRFIGEAEGKDNSAINIDKFRQLTSNIQEDLQREDVNSPAIGILFGNGYRLTRPSDRPEQFTDKCINTAKTSSCALVRTSDLFLVAKYVKESRNGSFAKNCRDAIKNGVGKIVNFPAVPIK
jgi:hypothetical protein